MRDVVVLASDTLAGSSLGELRNELGLEHEIVDVLRNWPGARHGVMIVDALDAARGERTQEALLDLIGAVAVRASHRWRIAASIRRFDLRYNTALQAIFASTTPAAEAAFQSAEFAALSHFNVPLLSKEELDQLKSAAPSLHQLIDSGTPELHDLARVPFNLRLLADLVGMNVDRQELEPITTQLQLLDKYWEHRVIRSRTGGDVLEAILRDACDEMIAARALRINRSVLQTSGGLAGGLTELLSSHILTEEEFDGRVRREVLAFAHHVLFDYAVARLLFRGTEEALLAETRERPELLVMVRPSYELHFRHLWGDDAQHESFWTVVLAIAAGDLPEIGKIVGPGVAARLVESLDDLNPLVAALAATDSQTRRAAELTLDHVVGARLAEDDPLPEGRRDAWARIVSRLSESLRPETLSPVGSLLMEFSKEPDRLDIEQREHVGVAARRMLRWAWEQPAYHAFAVGRAIEAVARTFEADPTESEHLLRMVLRRDRLQEHGYQEMPELAQEVPRLISVAPEFVRDIYVTAFDFEEASDERTQMRSGVLALSSHRRQDYERAHYALAEAYPAFLRAAPDQAIDALSAVRVAYARRRSGARLTDPELRAVWHSETVCIQPDGSYIWDANSFGHDHEVKILDAFEAWLGELAETRDVGQISRVIDHLRRSPRPAALWRRVLVVATRTPEPFVPLIEPLVVAPSLLLSLDLSSVIGDFLSQGFSRFPDASRERIENALMQLPEVPSDGTA